MKHKIFVDGQRGTTGLEIHQRLASRQDVQVLSIDPQLRRDPTERARLLNEADIVFLCLPDDAAIEAVSMIDNPNTKVIDASTAHRVHPDWAYGIPELSAAHREAIASSKRISNPGCYATAFAMLVYPLVAAGILSPDHPVTCHAVTGYSGGGKELIEKFEGEETKDQFISPSFYALALRHKHLPEMQKHGGLSSPPIFTPIVANYYRGMTVAIPLFNAQLQHNVDAQGVHAALEGHYAGQRFAKVMPFDAEAYGPYFNATQVNGTNRIELYVFGDQRQSLLLARLDNLGKGASGAAVQNMNIALGLPEDFQHA